MRYKIFFAAILIFCLPAIIFAVTSQVTKFPAKEANGFGPLPYNYRIIDGHIHAGGHPLNPRTIFMNTDKQVLSILAYLKSKGVNTVIDFENTWFIQKRYEQLLKRAGIRRIHIPLHASKLPNEKEWQIIKDAMKHTIYIHCTWGADRTGSMIGRYLVEVKDYAPKEAWEAVIAGGSHAGILGGLKTARPYRKLVIFFWPNAAKDPDFIRYYGR